MLLCLLLYYISVKKYNENYNYVGAEAPKAGKIYIF